MSEIYETHKLLADIADDLHRRSGAASLAYADWLYENRDNPDLWGDLDPEPDLRTPEERDAQRARFAVTIATHFSPEETRAINEYQRRTGETYGEIIRKAVKRYLVVENIRWDI